MRYYTDHPENSRGFLPGGCDWTEQEASLEVWPLLSTSQTVWTCAMPNATQPSPSARPLLIINHAEASQFDTILAALNRGTQLPDGMICLALAGDKHRGQRQRPWVALRGNLHLTAHYRLGGPVRNIEAAVSMVPAVATALAIDATTPPHCRPTIKWVNDILIEGRKVSGGLTATHVQGPLIESVVFGIGVNVAVAPELEGETMSAGSLAPFGVGLADFTHLLVQQLDGQVQRLRQLNSTAIYQGYRHYAGFIGRRVQIWPESMDGSRDALEPLHEGVVKELLPDLSLRLDTTNDPIRRGRLTYQ